MIKKPAKGGIPLIEKIRKEKKIAIRGFSSFSLANWFSLIVFRFIVIRINHIANELRI